MRPSELVVSILVDRSCSKNKCYLRVSRIEVYRYLRCILVVPRTLYAVWYWLLVVLHFSEERCVLVFKYFLVMASKLVQRNEK